MNNRKIALGPGAASLILIAVVLALAMLSMLSLVTAKNDEGLSLRSAEMTESVYRLNAAAELRLAELDAALLRAETGETDPEAYLAKAAEALPEGMALEGDTVFWTEPLENRYLDCRVRLLAPGSGKRTEWISHRLVVEESEDDGEWD